jgi:hypothetical protein
MGTSRLRYGVILTRNETTKKTFLVSLLDHTLHSSPHEQIFKNNALDFLPTYSHIHKENEQM